MIRALKAATNIAAELPGRSDLGVLAPGKLADIVAMPGGPIAAIGANRRHREGRIRNERWYSLSRPEPT